MKQETFQLKTPLFSGFTQSSGWRAAAHCRWRRVKRRQIVALYL